MTGPRTVASCTRVEAYHSVSPNRNPVRCTRYRWRYTGQHLADGGFAKLADIAALAQAGVEPVVPVPTPRTAGRDR